VLELIGASEFPHSIDALNSNDLLKMLTASGDMKVIPLKNFEI